MTNVITKIGVADVGPFKKQVVNIPTGIVYLYGKNLKKGDANGNAAGKSLFGAAVSEIFYDIPIVGTRQDKAKRGTRFVEFKRGSKLVRIKSSFKGRSQKLSVTINGEDKTGGVNKKTKELVSRLWPINENEYRTYGHLDTRKTHSLVGGSSTERKAFFTEFFGLDKLDAERKLIGAEIAKIKKTRAAHTELQKTFADMRVDMLTKDQRVEKERRAEELRGKVDVLKKRHEAATRIQQLLEFEKYAGNQLAELNKLVRNLDDFDSIYKSYRKRLRVAVEQEEQLAEWKDYVREQTRYDKAVSKLDMSEDMESLKEKAAKFTRAEAKLESAEDVRKPKKVDKPVPPKGDRDKAVAARERLLHELEHAKEFKTGKCGTCGQSVKARDLSEVRADLDSAKAKIAEWDAYAEQCRAYEAYHADRKEWEKVRDAKEGAERDIAKYKAAHALYMARKELRKPKEVAKPEDVESVTDLRKQVDLLAFFESHIPTIRKLKALTPQARKVKFDATELESLQSELSRIEAALEVHNSIRTRAMKIKRRLDELEEEMGNQEALELLYQGYSDKAVKKMIVEAINQHLMEGVNKFSSIAFDDYRFEFVWGTQIQLLVHRPGMETTDVRKLSGAESTLFTIVLLMALLMFVPAPKRLSLIFLDEPTASFSEETTELFHRLLPHLNKLIPTIFVITPDARERMEGAIEMTVIRDHQGARIVEGHPDEV